MNRQERRLYERKNQRKSTRKIDKKKLSKRLKEIAIIGMILYVVIFSGAYYVTNSQNNIRKTIAQDPKTINAKVLDISGKGQYASYDFIVNGKKFTGRTFNSYDGKVGDDICIIYSSQNPTYNLYYKEKETASIKKNVVFFSFEILGIYIVFIFLYLFYEILIGNKKLIAELSSRK